MYKSLNGKKKPTAVTVVKNALKQPIAIRGLVAYADITCTVHMIGTGQLFIADLKVKDDLIYIQSDFEDTWIAVKYKESTLAVNMVGSLIVEATDNAIREAVLAPEEKWDYILA
jgi:hypothetical protein